MTQQRTLAELMAASRARRTQAEALAAAHPRGLRFAIPDSRRAMLASVDTNPDGLGFRITHFAGREPTGHFEHRNLAAAILDALNSGAEPMESSR